MSNIYTPKFFDLYSTGNALAQEIDDYIDLWHSYAPTSEGRPLHEFLGLSEQEYNLWIQDSSALEYILLSRREQRPLKEIIQECTDAADHMHIAARAADPCMIKAFKRWLDARTIN